MEELKPCPFCGGEANITYKAKRLYDKNKMIGGVIIYCGTCEAQMFYTSEKLAVEAWNRRKDDGKIN